MNETWQIFLVGGLLSWIALELRELRQELKKFVTRHECETDMQHHCDRLDDLLGKVETNATDIRELKAKAEVWHRED